MDTDALAQQVQDTLIGIFQRGSRYQTEKVAVLVGYLLISVTSLVWAFSGKNLDNQLGADSARPRSPRSTRGSTS